MPMPMPALSPDLVDWLRPGAVGAGLAVVWTEIRGLHRRVDELREDVKDLREDVKDLRKDVNDLPMKMMEMLRKAPH